MGISGEPRAEAEPGREGERAEGRRAGPVCLLKGLYREMASPFLSFFFLIRTFHLLSSARCCVYGGGGRCGFYLTCWMHVNLRFPLPRAGQTDNTSGGLLQSAHAPATFPLLLFTLIQPRDIFQEQMGHPV